MKRSLNILLFILIVVLGSGCTVYRTADNVDTSDMNLQEGIFNKVITPFCRIVDLSDFYYRYRSIMGNETAVEKLKNSYFGETVLMERYGDEGVDVEYWGRIEPNDGSERDYSATLSPHWMGFEPAYSVSVTGNRSYYVVYNSVENAPLTEGNGYDVTLEGEVEVVGYHVAVKSLSIDYFETSLGRPLEIRVTAGSDDDTVMMNLCQEGEYTIYPVAGVLYYSVSGYITDSFKVVFYGDHFEVVEGDLAGPEAGWDE